MPLHLTSTDRDIVRTDLVRALVAANNPGAFFTRYLGAEVVARVRTPGTAAGWADAGLLEAEKADYAPDGTHPLIRLLKDLGAANKTILDMGTNLANIPRPPNPFNAMLLDNCQAFLDRETFRTKISSLLEPLGPVVLRLTGDRKSGKWYSYKFLMFLSYNGQQIVPISIQCGPSIGAISLAQTLLQQMGLPDWQQRPITEDQEKKETPLRVGQITADWFLNAALRSGEKWWFFVKFLDVSVAADTREFIRQLALYFANNPKARPSLRLVLLNFADELPTDLRRLQKHEEFKLDRTVWEANVQSYIGYLKTTVPPERHTELDDAQQDILTEIRAAADEEFLSVLCQEVEDLTEGLNG